VRAIAWEGDTLVVTVTPTYSGCPATAAIALDIREALERAGFEDVDVRAQLAPPWTTDWMSKEGLAKLQAYGVAPPAEAACAGAVAANEPSECPHCGSSRVERVSQFGSTPCKAAWRCAECLEPFDYFKRF
jgi:ring-1,2-phenylacetyl-CoA epoxidase subunit PaaD